MLAEVTADRSEIIHFKKRENTFMLVINKKLPLLITLKSNQKPFDTPEHTRIN
jgi:hypothetical protein